MNHYKKINLSNMEEEDIDRLYKDLLNQKYQFMILYFDGAKYVLTKERSIMEIENEESFLNQFNHDIYYKTIIKNGDVKIEEQDMKIYNSYIHQFKDKLTKKRYDDKYYFGCVAIKTKNGIITTIRGKEDLSDYTVIENVDHENHIIYVLNKKATLNAPLLDYLFQNEKVKAIVHLHEFDDHLPYYEYAFPGMVKDSIRNNTTSFNIRHHGIIYLFDKDGNIL